MLRQGISLRNSKGHLMQVLMSLPHAGFSVRAHAALGTPSISCKHTNPTLYRLASSRWNIFWVCAATDMWRRGLDVRSRGRFVGLLPLTQGPPRSPVCSLIDGEMIFYKRTLVFWLENPFGVNEERFIPSRGSRLSSSFFSLFPPALPTPRI